MPILHSALAMEGENYLHPEGPQLDSSLFSVASSNIEDLACIDDLSTNSLFSSPADSLSEYADSQSFINTDNLDTVPTLWDINTNTTNAPAQNQSEQHEVILQNNQRAGFLIGDGAGVGKGRTVAGIILENYLRGRKKALWFSISNDLKFDAERDLKDIDAPYIPVLALNKVSSREISDRAGKYIYFPPGIFIKYGDTATSEGVLFATYSALIGESQAGGQHRTRIKQILDWCKPDFDGVVSFHSDKLLSTANCILHFGVCAVVLNFTPQKIIFDECHKAKNATSTKMGKAVLNLQNQLPRARVVYASATGASEPKNMIYMSRLGIWGEGTPFRAFDDFLHAIEKRGVGAMEIVAMDMKVSGMYIARQLSFSGVSFRIEEIGIDSDLKLVYNKAAKLWAEALQVFMRAADELGLVSRKSLWAQFWSSHQRFFKYLCIAAKVRCLVELAQKELEAGKCIVVGLQSTGESRTREVLDENDGHLDRFVSAAEGVFQSLVTKHFPSEKQRREKAPGTKRKRKPRGRQPKVSKHNVDSGGVINISDDSSSDSDGMETDSNSSPDSLLDNDDVIFVNHTNGQTARIEEMKQDLLHKISILGKELPLNTLDELIDRFGGPDKVSEMTGRRGRVVRRPDGIVRYESRAEQGLTIDHINLKEKDRFMSGEKVKINICHAQRSLYHCTINNSTTLIYHFHFQLVAIISEAASSGISLQADKRVKNQRRRVHMTLELPWSADRAIQQFGRTHRSNQVTAPEYIFLISELAGERRFASIVAKRLESLGALTHGDRRATESRDLSKYNFENKYGTKALDKITKSIMGHIENKVPPPQDYPGGGAMFFRDMKLGMMDVGILCKDPRFGISTEKDCSITKFLNRILGLEVHKQNSLFQYFTDNFDYLIEKDKKEGKYDMGILGTVATSRFLLYLAPGNDEIYEERQENFLTAGNPQDGQVILYKISVDRGMPWDEAYNRSLKLSGPDEGFYLSLKVTPEEARDSWENQFTFSFKKCSHANWNGKCKRIEEGQECLQGMRLRQYHMLCGTLLRVWKRVADVVSDITSSSILQIVRLRTKQHNKQVGIKIPESCVARVREELLQMDEEVKRKRREREQQALEQQKIENRHLATLFSHPPLLNNSLLRGNHPCVLLAEQGRGKNFIVYKPNIGKQTQTESLDHLQQRYRKVTPEEARDSWENQFTFSFKKCSHANWNGKCKKIEEGQECLQGMRLRQYHMLCGTLLRVWKRVADVVSDITSSSILQIVRLKTKQHNKQVGIKIPESCVARVREELLQMDEELPRVKALAEATLQQPPQTMPTLSLQRNPCPSQQRTPSSWPSIPTTSTNHHGLLSTPANLLAANLQPQFHPQPFLPLFPPMKNACLPLHPSASSSSLSSNPLDEILDLTVSSPSPSPDTSEGGPSLDSLTRHSSAFGDDFNLEALISQPAAPLPPQNHVMMANNHQDVFELFDLCPQMSAQKANPSSSTSSGASSTSPVSSSLVLKVPAGLPPSSSSASSLFSSPPSSSLFSNAFPSPYIHPQRTRSSPCVCPTATVAPPPWTSARP
ncbi:unnamed protein product [Tetraodon nigroviridis]|uniref:(spotted green pufferfish) hypothetical protein n=1 Tax=Tetraodon nigroviridis TaxID=99883 RepID=Q4S3C6_TETNG|nr:unnamed protein product [Tetraodon nigroviridis]